jgi:hypothetical protein
VQCILQYAKHIGEGQWASRQSITYTCRYLQTAAKQSSTQEYLKPLLFDLLVHVAIPITFFNRELHEEWTEDPMEVIRRNSAALITVTTEDLYDPRDASVSLIRDVLKTKALSQVLLDPFMNAVLNIIVEFKHCGAFWMLSCRLFALSCATQWRSGSSCPDVSGLSVCSYGW